MDRDLSLTLTIGTRRLAQLLLAAFIVAIPPNLMSEPRSVSLDATFPSPNALYGRVLTTGLEGHTILGLDGGANGNVGIGLAQTAAPAGKLTIAQNNFQWTNGFVVEEDPDSSDRAVVYQGAAGRLMFGRLDPDANQTSVAAMSDGGMNVGRGLAGAVVRTNGMNVQSHMGIGVLPSGTLNPGTLVVSNVIGDNANPGCRWEAPAGGPPGTGITAFAVCANGFSAMGWEQGVFGEGKLAECSTGQCAFSYSGRVLCCRLSHP